ncbi:hypothetical protein NL676_028903 [Syzygium grande]|nr:hypothetical protein NL676_028903 [Syzygium grande]
MESQRVVVGFPSSSTEQHRHGGPPHAMVSLSESHEKTRAGGAGARLVLVATKLPTFVARRIDLECSFSSRMVGLDGSFVVDRDRGRIPALIDED